MSKMTLYKLQCPHCGNKQETRVWDSINVTNDPNLKEKLFSAEINIFGCGHCGEKTFIRAPLLYHDMALQFCVQYYPPESLDDPDFFQNFNQEGYFAMAGIPVAIGDSGDYLIKSHIVFDMNEMIHYVMFRDRIAIYLENKE